MFNNHVQSLVKSSLQLIRFDKPIGTLLLLWPTLWGLFIAQQGIAPLRYIIIFSIGVLLTRSAGCAFNDLADSKFDAHVARTKNRPLVAKHLNNCQGLVIAISLSIIALILAITTLSTKTILISIPAAIIYTTYPWVKRFFPIPQLYLGIAFSCGILMAFMQICNGLPYLALILFIANCLWTIGYDTIYAMVDLEDDLKIGIKTSAITFGRYVWQIVGLCYTGFIGFLIYIGISLSFTPIYFLCIIIAACLLIYQIVILFNKEHPLYLKMFLLNNWVGIIIFIGIVINYL
jgi:4-hydroxybenzoate polyprenyltransferase